MTPSHIRAVLLTLPPLLLTTPALAGPTLSADLDLGTSTQSFPPGALPPSPLYILGFVLRAGWRFDLAPVWFLPEVGVGYADERFAPVVGSPSPNAALTRFFGGGRIGWSSAVGPRLHLEPAIYGHVGAGWYDGYYNQMTGYACDVGVSLDLRIRQHLLVGAQLGYDVVTIPPQPVLTPAGAGYVTTTAPAIADPWVSYGLHAGWLFW